MPPRSLKLAVLLLAFAARGQAPQRMLERLTFQQRIDRTEKALVQIRNLVSQTQKLLDQAKDEKDIVKLNCVGDRLVQVRGLLRVSEGAATELKEAAARKEEEAAEHEFTKVALASSKVVALRADAEQCIGQLAYYSDEKTLVDVEIPKGLPTSDPTWVAPPRSIEVRQPFASGF